MKTCYEVLEIHPSASDEIIDMAYLALSKKYNPATYSGDKGFAEHKMLMINKAYGILSDPETRRKYDLYLQRQDIETPAVRKTVSGNNHLPNNTVKTKYCTNCSKPIEETATKCLECGAAQEHNITEQRTQHRSPSSKHNNTKLVLILMTVCVFIPMLFFTILGNIGEKKVSPVGEEHVEEMNIEEEYIEESIVSTYHEEQVLQDETMLSVVEEPTMPEESFYIKRSRAIAEKEYDKYLENEALVQFTQKANSNQITLDMLNRQPGYYEGKEVYFGGTVLQAIYDKEDSSKVQLRIEDRNTTSTQNVVYVSYTLGEYETRILEDDYVDMYGTFDGMITYQSVGSGPITIPHVIGKVVYCYADATGLQDSPTAQALKKRVDGQFRGERGELFSFATVKDAEMNYFSGPTDYGDCIVAYFIPDMGWDEYTNPPFYRVTAFKDGKLVVFEPNENAEAGVNSIDDGVYREYTFIEGSDQTQTGTTSYAQSSSVSNGNTTESKVGYVTESSGGLKIRSGPSTSYEEIGRLAPLEAVTIYETTYSDNRNWGKIDRGWVCMDYIAYGTTPSRTSSGGYDTVLNQYRTAQASNFQNCGQYVGESFSYLSNWGAQFEVYYANINLNNDGISELVIGGKDLSSNSSIEIMDLFTLNGNTPQRLVNTSSLGHRAHLYLYPDGTFATSGSGGASTHSTEFYTLYSYSCSATITHGYGTDMGVPYYYGSDGNSRTISESELNSLPTASQLTQMNISWNRLN